MLRLPIGAKTVFGPLRDRAPENAASSFTMALQQGGCPSSPRDAQLLNTTCEKERRIPITDLKLVNREAESNGSLRIVYAWGNSQIPISHRNPVEIEVVKTDGSWHVVTYDRVF
jgi:hypothetical protein